MADRSRGEAVTVEPPPVLEPEPARRGRLAGVLARESYALSYVGIVVTLAGFGLLVLAWSKIAGLDQVWEQMPYLVSAAFPGIGLVMAGLVMISTAIKRQDAAERERQVATLAAAVARLSDQLDRK